MEKAREAGAASPRVEPWNRPTANKMEKKETKTRVHADGEAGRKESRTQTQGQGKDAPPKEAQGGAKTMDREFNIKGKGREQI